MAVDCLGRSFCFCAPARLRKIATPLSATKTNAQKISIPRDDRCGCFGNWSTDKKYAIYFAAIAKFAAPQLRHADRKQLDDLKGYAFGGIAGCMNRSGANFASRHPVARLRGRECSDGTQAIQSAQSMPPEQR